jgi:osmotically-inducible protein OsmY
VIRALSPSAETSSQRTKNNWLRPSPIKWLPTTRSRTRSGFVHRAQKVRPRAVDSSLDSGIEDNYNAAIKAHKKVDDQSISYSSKNGTLVLKGSVRTSAQKNEASKLAKSIPGVKEVVNEIEVKSDKQSTSQ